jgi:trimeric autotransporter adhesin
MKTLTRILRLFNLGSGAHRRRVGECQGGAASLGEAEGASHALKTAFWPLVVLLSLTFNLVHAQTATCVAPGCNSVRSDNSGNTAMGTSTLPSVSDPGSENTAAGGYALYSNTTGAYNAALGFDALYSNTTANNNTASGAYALFMNTTGSSNTASGFEALQGNVTGSFNTASGYQALQANDTGNSNTASGAGALSSNTTGNDNTAAGFNALSSNTTGDYNTASGFQALHLNTVGSDNTGVGYLALYTNQGGANTASGFQALSRNTYGNHNTAAGFNAIFANTTGNDNTGVGYLALSSNTTGLNNIALGTNAGYAVTGSNNIDIGSTGSGGESGVIRIGGPSQSAAYIAGISSTQLTGSAVYVAANGQLGVLASSERYKTEIAPLSGSTQKLQELRPVSFHLKSDPKGAVQYGLIAEEVNKVFPELVIRDEAGTIQGVRYDELAPMLLSEVQKQERKIDAQAAQISELKQQLAGIQAALATFQPKDQLVAKR